MQPPLLLQLFIHLLLGRLVVCILLFISIVLSFYSPFYFCTICSKWISPTDVFTDRMPTTSCHRSSLVRIPKIIRVRLQSSFSSSSLFFPSSASHNYICFVNCSCSTLRYPISQQKSPSFAFSSAPFHPSCSISSSSSSRVVLSYRLIRSTAVETIPEHFRHLHHLLPDRQRTYKVREALSLLYLKFAPACKDFCPSFEAKIRLNIDPRHTDKIVRGVLQLAYPVFVCSRKVAVVTNSEREQEAIDSGADYVGGEDLVEKIRQTYLGRFGDIEAARTARKIRLAREGVQNKSNDQQVVAVGDKYYDNNDNNDVKIIPTRTTKTTTSDGLVDFDILICSPDMMGKVGSLGKYLGPRGRLPTPRLGTVTQSVGEVTKLYKRKTTLVFRADRAGIVAMKIGQHGTGVEELVENLCRCVRAVKQTIPTAGRGASGGGKTTTTKKIAGNDRKGGNAPKDGGHLETIRSVHVTCTSGPAYSIDRKELNQIT
eukprot:GHVS01050908.1.p1 GENE.GHVS01050908.1~~GHVS01050908.1.p1  ORF type:complete len:485 (+),score=56.92 GHVS01050908.1:81-1535(+)